MTYQEFQKSFLENTSQDKGGREQLATFWMMLFHVTNWSRLQFELHKNESVKANELKAFSEITDRLNKGEPIQYIIGHVEFYGNAHLVNSDVLIPRPETEELVDWIISEHKLEKEKRYIDIGTGSGCIINSLALNLNGSFTGLDVSESALEVAKRTGVALKSNVVFRGTDILKPHSGGGGYDIIVSNPPYIPVMDKAYMEKNVLEFEPELALFVPDEDPLLFYKAIVNFGLKNLNKNGVIYFEIHEDYKDDLKVLVQDNNYSFEFRKDMQGKMRMLKIWDLV